MRAEVRRRVRAQAPFLLILLIVVGVFGYLLLEPGHWVRGTALIAGAMLLAGALRLVLPESRIGMLAVRGRWWDTLCYVVLGGVILAVDLRLRY